MFDKLLTLFLCLLYYVCCVSCDCKLSMKTDFNSLTPVFIRNGDFMAPNARGDISFKTSEALEVACPGNGNSIVLKSGKDSKNILHKDIKTGSAVLTAQCVAGSSFHIHGYTALMKDVSCSSHPWSHVEDTKVSCYTGSTLYNVGYMVNNKLHKLYEACFNLGTYVTTYVKHEMSPAANILQPGRPNNFIEGELFRNTNIKDLYSTKENIKQLDHILGQGFANRYITDKQYLTKGHLAAQSDFPFFSQKRLSFHYINIAPQWESSNNGDWKLLEGDLKSYVKTLGRGLTVYTGTHGVMELPNVNGKMTPIYLGVDKNGNNILPVPKFFYKLVYNENEKSATAFITINSAFYTDQQRKTMRFCKDICSGNAKYKWLSWRPTQDSNFFCCSYEEFIKTVTYLPKLTVVVPKGPVVKQKKRQP